VSTEQPWTIGRLLEWTTQFLARKGAESPRLDAQLLLSHALGCTRTQLYTRYEELASEEGRQKFRELVQQRVQGRPVFYLVGRREFYSLEFEVSPAVLIPRPDTETLVGECLRLAREVAAPRILDVGTGSGCVAVTVARHHKGAQVTAVDLSPEALAVAARNAARHGVSERVRFLEGDLFAPLPPGEPFDCIVSNPPYVPRGEIAGLAPDVRDHEPHLALDGGPDGFAVFDRLVAGAPAWLKPGGYLLLEINSTREGPARARLGGHAGYELDRTIHDRAGQPRVLRARRRPAAEP
jgi:release factor glutamine methyltransferase